MTENIDYEKYLEKRPHAVKKCLILIFYTMKKKSNKREL